VGIVKHGSVVLLIVAVKNVDYLNIRLPRQLTLAIERERQRMSKKIGAEVKTSAIVRAALEKQFVRKARAA